MDVSGWEERFKHRNDITTRITHLTNGDTPEKAFENLLSILEDRTIKGGHGYVCGSDAVVCLQEAPLGSIAENLLYERALRKATESTKHRYRAFGLRFTKIHIYKLGGRPVIYGPTSEFRNILPQDEWWRIVDLQLNHTKSIVDWTHEREWRIKGDLTFTYNQIEVILPCWSYYQKFVKYCLDNSKEEMLKEIRGIISLDSVYV